MDKKVVTEINKYLANIAVMYVKVHNLHWNVTGTSFKASHEYLETIYDGLAESFDAVAEALKMHGEKPLASLKSYLEVATIKEIPSEEMCACKAFEIVLADLKEMKALGEAIRAQADAAGLYDIVSLIEGDLANFAKTIWFISAMGK
ncbi:MAG: DNA starvation/stationary phase protection protein [Opitutae bacterium]|nr:DNA starvation/stationary phase protection protein [Opitutae bacterium]MCD8299235.1 DNA starvation/stationary phase protection protein [Opitutae bacterium]